MLPIHGSFDRVRYNFARQFVSDGDGDGYLYRRGQRGAPYRVTTKSMTVSSPLSTAVSGDCSGAD